MEEGYFVEPVDGMWQSVFPSDKSEYSQLHTNIADAIEYIRSVAGNVKIEVLE